VLRTRLLLQFRAADGECRNFRPPAAAHLLLLGEPRLSGRRLGTRWSAKCALLALLAVDGATPRAKRLRCCGRMSTMTLPATTCASACIGCASARARDVAVSANDVLRLADGCRARSDRVAGASGRRCGDRLRRSASAPSTMKTVTI